MGTKAIFTSHPILKFMLGSYVFTDGTLTFEDGVDGDGNRLEDFRALLVTLPPMARNTIKEIGLGLAEQIAALALAQNAGRVTTGADGGISPSMEDALRRQAIPQFGSDSAPIIIPPIVETPAVEQGDATIIPADATGSGDATESNSSDGAAGAGPSAGTTGEAPLAFGKSGV